MVDIVGLQKSADEDFAALFPKIVTCIASDAFVSNGLYVAL